MIKTEEQYEVTKKQIEKFQITIADLEDDNKVKEFHPKLIKAKKDALLSEISNLQKSLDEYDRRHK